jgi:hypothetical protein
MNCLLSVMDFSLVQFGFGLLHAISKNIALVRKKMKISTLIMTDGGKLEMSLQGFE